MEVKRIVIEDITSLVMTVMQHNGGEGFNRDIPDSTKGSAGFLCRIKCNDGTIIDFSPPTLNPLLNSLPKSRETLTLLSKRLSKT